MVPPLISAPVLGPSIDRAIEEPFPAPLERRRHKRFNITLLGRFMRENKQEFPCKLRDISIGQSLRQPQLPAAATRPLRRRRALHDAPP
jgi:hypothetical protein